MPYCVLCGVSLEAFQKTCPLCQTPVVLPPGIQLPQTPAPYPAPSAETMAKADRRFAVALTSILLGLPGGLCLLIDLLFQRQLGWSLYVAGTLGVAWVAVAVPTLARRAQAALSILADTAALALFLLLVYGLAGGGQWYLPLALPVVVLLGALVLGTVTLCQRFRLPFMHRAAVVLGGISVFLLGLEACIDGYAFGRISLDWSPLAALPCVAITLLLLEINRHEAVKEQIRRRLHF